MFYSVVNSEVKFPKIIKNLEIYSVNLINNGTRWRISICIIVSHIMIIKGVDEGMRLIEGSLLLWFEYFMICKNKFIFLRTILARIVHITYVNEKIRLQFTHFFETIWLGHQCNTWWNSKAKGILIIFKGLKLTLLNFGFYYLSIHPSTACLISKLILLSLF